MAVSQVETALFVCAKGELLAVLFHLEMAQERHTEQYLLAREVWSNNCADVAPHNAAELHAFQSCGVADRFAVGCFHLDRLATPHTKRAAIEPGIATLVAPVSSRKSASTPLILPVAK